MKFLRLFVIALWAVIGALLWTEMWGRWDHHSVVNWCVIALFVAWGVIVWILEGERWDAHFEHFDGTEPITWMEP